MSTAPKYSASFSVSSVKALIDQISITFNVDMRYISIQHADERSWIRCKYCRKKAYQVLQLGGDKVDVSTEQCRMVRCIHCLRLLVLGKDCMHRI